MTCSLQILNRTNNIFELVTVEPILTERPPDRQKDEILLSDELDSVDDRTLRLKGNFFDISIQQFTLVKIDYSPTWYCYFVSLKNFTLYHLSISCIVYLDFSYYVLGFYKYSTYNEAKHSLLRRGSFSFA